MATPMGGLTSQASTRATTVSAHPAVHGATWDLDDDRIMIDIETEMIARGNAKPGSQGAFPGEGIFHHLREGRNVGPLSVLLMLLAYFWLSPLLPATVHEYIYHILH